MPIEVENSSIDDPHFVARKAQRVKSVVMPNWIESARAPFSAHSESVLPLIIDSTIPQYLTLTGDNRLETPRHEPLLYDTVIDAAMDISVKNLDRILVENPRRPGEWQALASGETGEKKNEVYATPFIRDFCLFAIGLVDAVKHGVSEYNGVNIEEQLDKVKSALTELESYQSFEDDPTTGKRYGTFPHELRFPYLDANKLMKNDRFEIFRQKGWPIYQEKDQEGNVTDEKMICYDASEGPHLYVKLVAELEQLYPGFMNEKIMHSSKTIHERKEHFRAACQYIINNSKEHNGLAGFINDIPFDFLEDKQSYGEQLTKESYSTLRTANGLTHREIRDQGDQTLEGGIKPKPGEPISGLQTTAIKFTAELMAADYFEKEGDIAFAQELRTDARITKRLFNSPSPKGFLRYDENGLPYFSELIATNPLTNHRESSPHHSSIIVHALAFSYLHQEKDGSPKLDFYGKPIRECVIDSKYIPLTAAQLEGEFLIPGLGLTTYSPDRDLPIPPGRQNTLYWQSPRTVWGPESGLAACGLWDFGFKKAALRIGRETCEVIESFNAPVENWLLDKNGGRVIWSKESEKGEEQEGCRIQAFTMGTCIGFGARVFSERDRLANKTNMIREAAD